MATIVTVIAIVFVLSWIPAGIALVRARRRQAGERIITCPESKTREVVRVDAGHAAWTELRGETELRLESCSRWPERASCGQQCLAEIECAADGCLVRERLGDWYRAAKCVFCGLPIGEPGWLDHKPGLRSNEGKVIEWKDVEAKDLDRVLATSQPVCFDCTVAEIFRDRFPDRVVDDPWHPFQRPGSGPPGPMA